MQTTARFTKKHYEFLADVVRNLAAITDADREKVARQMAEHFEATQPSFNRSRFIGACRGIAMTPNPYDEAIAEQHRVVSSLYEAYKLNPDFEHHTAFCHAASRLDAMANGRHATPEESAWLDQHNPMTRRIIRPEPVCQFCGSASCLDEDRDNRCEKQRRKQEGRIVR